VLSVGVIALLFSHIFVNMAMTVGLMPITGLPLPLVSYGGSFMMCTMLGLGLVQSVYVRRIRR
jgi:rod shape determining protein RodA